MTTAPVVENHPSAIVAMLASTHAKSTALIHGASEVTRRERSVLTTATSIANTTRPNL
jgi:hypothetical protein